MRTIDSVAKEVYERVQYMDSLCGFDPGQPVKVHAVQANKSEEESNK